MKKTINFFLCLFVINTLVYSQIPTFSWLSHSNTLTSNSSVLYNDTELDHEKNIIFVGSYFKNVQLGEIIFQDETEIYRNSYITKLDQYGNFLWSLDLNSTLQISATSVEIDSDSNIYIVGQFSGNVNFGSFTLISDNQTNPYNSKTSYITKISKHGEFLWAKKIENIGIFNLEINNNDELIFMAVSHGQYTFDDVNYFSEQPGYSIVKFTNDGNYIWLKRIIDNGNNGFGKTSIKTDQHNNIYISCSFSQSAQLGSFIVYGNNLPDILVTKMDDSGTFIWVANAGGEGYDYGQGLVFDEHGNIFISGGFSSQTINFGPNSIHLYEDNKDDLYIAKLNSSGEFLWAKSIPDQGLDAFQDLAIDNNGQIFLTHYKSIPSVPEPKVRNLDSDGNIVWEKIINSSIIGKVLFDSDNNMYMGGTFDNVCIFDNFQIEVISPNIFIGKLTNSLFTHENHSEKFSLTPNPINQEFKINSNYIGKYDIKIIDNLGKTVWEKDGNILNQTFNINNLPSGIYYVIIETAKTVYTEKIIKK